MGKINNIIDSIINSKFTLKIMLLTLMPVLFISTFLLLVLPNRIDRLNSEMSNISSDSLNIMYNQMINDKNNDIKEKISLKLNSVMNELNILRADAQRLIDTSDKEESPIASDYDLWIQKHMVYNHEKNRSTLSNNEFNVGMGVWGYLHNNDGSINQETKRYISIMAPILPILKSIGENGVSKGWLYVVGPKETPVMIETPWVELPQTFDALYPKHNENNWWDFFFPGMIESWNEQKTFKNETLSKSSDQITLTPLYEDAGGTGLMVTFFAPLWSKDRAQNFGAVAVDYNMSNITAMVKDQHLSKNGFTFLLQSNGDIIDATTEITNKLELKKDLNRETGVEVVNFNLRDSRIKELAETADMLHDGNTSKIIEFSNRNEQFILSYEKLMDYNLWNGQKIVKDKLYVVSIVPKDELVAIQDKIHSKITGLFSEALFFIVLLSFMILVISFMSSVWYALRNTKQIRLISQGLSQVGEDNYNVSIAVISNDEVGSLAKTFNQIVKEISRAHNELERYTIELEDKVKERTLHLEAANEKLELLSQIDGLTQIYNRRYFDTSLEKIWNEYLRLSHPISIIMIDIDYYKKYNDCYGHQEGDLCLYKVASVLQQQANRSSDVVARYGGEEFVVIACVDKEDAFNLAEKIRLTVKSLAIEHQLSEKGIVTLSLGVASVIPSHDKQIGALVKAADKALYESKRNGRDKVSVNEY